MAGGADGREVKGVGEGRHIHQRLPLVGGQQGACAGDKWGPEGVVGEGPRASQAPVRMHKRDERCL